MSESSIDERSRRLRAADSGSSVTSRHPANVKKHIINCEPLVNARSGSRQ